MELEEEGGAGKEGRQGVTTEQDSSCSGQTQVQQQEGCIQQGGEGQIRSGVEGAPGSHDFHQGGGDSSASTGTHAGGEGRAGDAGVRDSGSEDSLSDDGSEDGPSNHAGAPQDKEARKVNVLAFLSKHSELLSCLAWLFLECTDRELDCSCQTFSHT